MRGFDQCGHFSDKGSSSDADIRHFLMQKPSNRTAPKHPIFGERIFFAAISVSTISSLAVFLASPFRYMYCSSNFLYINFQKEMKLFFIFVISFDSTECVDPCVCIFAETIVFVTWKNWVFDLIGSLRNCGAEKSRTFFFRTIFHHNLLGVNFQLNGFALYDYNKNLFPLHTEDLLDSLWALQYQTNLDLSI